MICKNYNLPDWSFIGGSSQKIILRMLYEGSMEPMDLSGCTVRLSVMDGFGTGYEPMVARSGRIVEYDTVGHVKVPNGVELTLDPSDTIDWDGKYIYQVTLRDTSGRIDQMQGSIYVRRNIDPGHALS